MSKQDSSHSSRMFKILPPILTVGLVALCIYIGSKMSIQGLISYTPSNVLLAAAGILALFAVKSLSVIFPLSVLYIVSAFWFGRWVGLAVCYLGLVVSCTIPYLLGRHFGAGMVEQLLCKYPKLRQLQSVGDSNQLMFSYLLRIVSVLPGDLCSLFLGACSVDYRRYLIGSLLGLSPMMILHVLFADLFAQSLSGSFWEALTPQTIVVIVVLVVISIISSVILNKSYSPKEPPADRT